MKRKIFILFVSISFCFITRSVYAEETIEYKEGAIFLSLTKKAQPMAKMPTNLSIVTGNEIERTGAKNIGQALDLSNNLNIGKYGTLGSLSSLILRGALTTPEQNRICFTDGFVFSVLRTEHSYKWHTDWG